MATVTYPNSLQSTFGYDQQNRLTSMTASTAGYLYTLGPTWNRTNVTELSGRYLTWNYDGIYRLTSFPNRIAQWILNIFAPPLTQCVSLAQS